jgi:hypothetical protein
VGRLFRRAEVHGRSHSDTSTGLTGSVRDRKGLTIPTRHFNIL